MNIILCGLPKCGKTTLGQLLAKRLGWDFLDTDQLVEKEFASKKGKHLSAREIYRQEGERFFRLMEKQQIASLKEIKNTTLSVGGGSLSDPENLQILQQIGDLYYLKASPEYLWKRIEGRGIPVYLDPKRPEQAFYELAQRRIPRYEQAANTIIEVEHRSKEEIVDQIRKTRHGK